MTAGVDASSYAGHARIPIRPVPIESKLAHERRNMFTVSPHPHETELEAERRRRQEMHRARRRPIDGVATEDTTLGGVPCRRYYPQYEPRGELIWLHGGGWMYGDAGADDAMCARFAAEASLRVTSVGYRLAPEHPYPAPLLDVLAVHRAVQEVASGPLLVAGASAGAALAASLGLMLRDQGETVPAVQLLICPPLDPRGVDHDSGPLTRSDLGYFWSSYLGGMDADGISAPALAGDLSGLPATHIYTTSSDPLRLEGWRWALRLVAAGVKTEARFVPGGYHGFEYEVPEAAFSQKAVSEWVNVLRRSVQEAGSTAACTSTKGIHPRQNLPRKA